jgi:2',3'-cyclic-nucleotide 2'-phosphodiesterase (5'-nucleotidase family)
MLHKKYILFLPLIPSILNIINISNYEYPHPESENSNYYTISIFQTNDIHGYTLPVENIDPRNGEKYLRGGVELISTYIKILKEEWKERFIWFDIGDSF